MELPKSGLGPTLFAALLRPFLHWLDKPSLPQYDGEIILPGLKKSVTVRWNAQSIPHVLAENENDLFFAQGFLHAQERLWQMEMSRRFLSGRMAEIFGDFKLPWKELSAQFRERTSADLDYFIRLIGIRRAASASLASLTEPHRLRLGAYCDGVNRYIEKCSGKLPWEFRLLRHHPEPWQAEDTLTIGEGLAFLLSTALYTRLNFIAVASQLKNQPEKLRALFPAYPDTGPVTTRAVWDQVGALWRFTGGLAAAADWQPAGAGSNGWTVAPHRSTSGAALLCNDPHLRMTLPSAWYLIHLQADATSSRTDAYDVWGASIPGCPFIQLGRNRWIAWGATAAVCDDVELYREKLHPLEPDLYRVGSGWQKLESRRETIKVRRSQPREKTIRFTRHGPVISDFSETHRLNEVIALRWTAHEPGRDQEALYNLNRARNWQEFRESLRNHAVPTLNFIYADTTGNIGYTLAGKIPRRAETPTLLPLAGWDEKNDWRGYIPLDELPHLYNPPQGIIATANNRVADKSYPYYLSHFFEPPHRARRIQDLLSQREKFSRADMAALQLDDVSLHARELVAALKTDLVQISDLDEILKTAVERLLSWDGSCAASSVEAAIFHVFHHRLLNNLLSPDLGAELFAAYVEILNQCIVPTDRILGDPGSPWFAGRSRAELVAVSLRQACAELAESLGTNVEKWRWGEIHRLHMNHSLGRIPILKSLLGIGPLPTGGDGMSINMGFYRHSNPYMQTVGASLRFIADLAGPHGSEFVLPSGQSGHPSSPHYADQTGPWLNGERISMPSLTHDQSLSDRILLLKPV
ncbi:MAG: penicillin acylase family protein [Chloroflexota bacterium]